MPDGEEALSSFHPCQDYNSLATISNHHNSISNSIRCTHPFAALIHSLHSFIRCTHPFAALIYSLHSSIRCTYPFAAFIHSLHSSIRYTHLFAVLIYSLHLSRRINAREARVLRRDKRRWIARSISL
jgi:hypothetical protein